MELVDTRDLKSLARMSMRVRVPPVLPSRKYNDDYEELKKILLLDNKDFYVYDVETITDYENGKQDGVYYVTVLTSDVIPSASPFNTNQFGFSQPLSNLYPQLDRDNPNQSPKSSVCHALSKTIGQVVIDDDGVLLDISFRSVSFFTD